MNAYETVVKKAIEAADQIKDADARVQAYCCILGFVKEKDVKLEKEAVECLRVGMKRGNVKCATYILDYLGYKPTDNINITSGDINITIDE